MCNRPDVIFFDVRMIDESESSEEKGKEQKHLGQLCRTHVVYRGSDNFTGQTTFQTHAIQTRVIKPLPVRISNLKKPLRLR